jgi:predicted Fe-Mo cluster-binding NifX family protein
MRIAVAAEGPGLQDRVSDRFGRCPYFLIADTDTWQFTTIPNTPSDLASGLGLQAAWTVVNQRVSAVIAGEVGRNARRILEERGVRIVTGMSGLSARQAIEQHRTVMR